MCERVGWCVCACFLCFCVTRLLDTGVLLVAVDYRNFPCAQMPDMIDDVCKGVAWVLANIKTYGGDPDNVILMGQSAGAHLTAMALIRHALAEANFRPNNLFANNNLALENGNEGSGLYLCLICRGSQGNTRWVNKNMNSFFLDTPNRDFCSSPLTTAATPHARPLQPTSTKHYVRIYSGNHDVVFHRHTLDTAGAHANTHTTNRIASDPCSVRKSQHRG